jgi:hypothetical protein
MPVEPSAIVRSLQGHALSDLTEQGDVVRVAGHLGRHHAADRTPQKIEIADDVENLVAGKLVRKAEVGVDDSVIVDQDAIVQSSTVHEAQLLELFYILEKAEGPGRGDLLFEGLGPSEDVGMILDPDRLGIVEDIGVGSDFYFSTFFSNC